MHGCFAGGKLSLGTWHSQQAGCRPLLVVLEGDVTSLYGVPAAKTVLRSGLLKEVRDRQPWHIHIICGRVGDLGPNVSQH